MTRAITKKELYDEDWQTQLARGYENIPANTIVEVLGNANNLYGSYTKVRSLVERGLPITSRPEPA